MSTSYTVYVLRSLGFADTWDEHNWCLAMQERLADWARWQPMLREAELVQAESKARAVARVEKLGKESVFRSRLAEAHALVEAYQESIRTHPPEPPLGECPVFIARSDPHMQRR